MSNRAIHSFKIPQYNQSSYGTAIYPTHEPVALGFAQDVTLSANVSAFRIIRKIGGRRLAWPLILSVYYEDDLIFVESDMPDLWGEGVTFEEALKSYEDFFFYEFESYKNSPPEEMDFFALQELKLYKALLNIS